MNADTTVPTGDMVMILTVDTTEEDYGKVYLKTETGWQFIVDMATSAEGLTGPTGPQGATGIVGPTGEQGIQGATGEQGPIGPQGATGETGLTGLQGETGIQGATGEKGQDGINGENGEQGPQGATGPQGETGEQGIQGVTGEIGATGADGKDGATPEIVDGYWWINGINIGIQAQGATGAAGATGPQGATGPAGEGTSYTAGTNINITGNTISAKGYTYNESLNSFEVGTNNSITSNKSFLIGEGLTSCDENCLVIGQYNNPKYFGADKTLFVVGDGASADNKNTVFLIQKGKAACRGAVDSNQSWVADFAEYFEWADGNPNNEDRVGYMVQMNDTKIEKATDFANCIGIVSGTAAFISGGCLFEWHGKYLRDDFGRELKDENGESILNPNYNKDLEYIPREYRKEWSPIGLVGQVLTRQDGTLKIGGFAGCKDGIATNSTTGYRVLRIINENVALLLVK